MPFIYWAKFVTLQGNLVNAPFAVGLVNKFLAVDCFLILYVLQLFFILVLCSASQVVTSLAAMALPNWRHLELGLGLVSIPCSVIFHFLLPFARFLWQLQQFGSSYQSRHDG